jgi:phage gp29-like protein
MAQLNTKIVDALTGEILSSERLYNFMGFSGGLGGGGIFIPDDPSVVWEQLKWNHAFAQYVYDDIEEKDEEVGSDLEVRKEAVLSKERFVQPASEMRQDKKLAEFVSETLEGYMGGSDGLRFGFNAFLWEALDATGKGVVIGENIFENANDRVYVKEVKFKPQMLFNFAEGPLAQYQSYALPQTGPLRLRADLGFMFEGIDPNEPLPAGKFFVHTFQPRQGNRWGSPLIRRCYWLAWIKKAGLKQWLRYLERGAGTVLTKYPTGASADEKDKALQASQAIAEEASAAVSKGTEVEVLENVRSSLGSSHKELTDEYCNHGIARRILGQTTTRGGEGGFSKGNVPEHVAERKTEADSQSLMLNVNTQLVWPIVLSNFGPVERPPIWMIKYRPGADLKLMSEALYRAWQMRVPIGKTYYYTTMQMEQPEADEELLPPPSKSDETSAVPGGTGGESASFAEGEDVKKKSGNRPLKPPTLKRERFAKLRPSMIESSRD